MKLLAHIFLRVCPCDSPMDRKVEEVGAGGGTVRLRHPLGRSRQSEVDQAEGHDFRQNVEQFLFEQASNLDRKYSSKKDSVRLSYSLLVMCGRPWPLKSKRWRQIECNTGDK
ncbi:PREDICTED: uncharacterized protein LOC107343737 [Acropora digitifera]|uniref:uncharacterized protein LOC107343737 n=1 Tax=Acropora digitifera TaxID=70779 RepID=UPI00077A0542|nr:PREDICTED: uncharacterized protein LOC107343737 [Acropora digitifera]